jgi:uncharacterized membrane protein
MSRFKRAYIFFRQQIKTVKPKHLVWILIFGYTFFFSLYTLLKHYTFQTSAGDLGFYEQSFWSTLHGKFFYTTVWEDIGNTPFAHHFQPMLFLLLPIYAIYPSPETLLVLQSFFLALAALPLYWIAKKKLGETWGVVFAGLYLMYPALHGINQFDFHVEAFAIPFLLFSFHYAEEKQYPKFFLFALLTLTCKEDVALTLVFFSFYLLWLNKKALMDKRIKSQEVIFPLALILISLAWFFISIRVIVPHFNKKTEYIFLERFYPSFVQTYNPIPDLLYEWNKKILFVTLLLAPLAFLPLLSPYTFFITLPAFATILLGRYPHAYVIGYQYSYAIIPFLFVSAVYGIKRLKKNEKTLKKLLGLMICLGIIFMLFFSLTPLGILRGNIPYGEYKGFPQITFHEKALYKMLELIPENESVSTQNNIFPHLSHRFNVYVGYKEGVTYILFDMKREDQSFPLSSLEEVIGEYGLVASIDQILLYKRWYTGELMNITV